MNQLSRCRVSVLVIFAMMFQLFAGTVASADMGIENKIALISVLPDWRAFTYSMTKEDASFVEGLLKKYKKSLSSPIGIVHKNGKLFVNSKEIKFEGGGKSINYNGHVITYNSSKSFQWNYEKIYS